VAIELRTVEDLANYAGRPVEYYNVLGNFATEAISQATLLLSLATGITQLPTTEPDRSLAIYAILETADKIFKDRLFYSDGPVKASESIGSYSYSLLSQKVKDGLATGLSWFDMAVERLSIWDTGNHISSTSISVFENDGVVRVGRHRWVPGPAAWDQIANGYIMQDPSMVSWYSGEGDYFDTSPSPGTAPTPTPIPPPVDEDDSFTYYQNEPSSEWIIVHNMDEFPSVTVVNSVGEEVVPDIVYVDNNTLKVISAQPFSGTAYLNS
jgi:hypothetical protein